jgi:hypothetical protein
MRVRYSIIILSSALFWIVGCASKPVDDPDEQLMASWSCNEKLYQSHIRATADESVALFLLHEGKASKAQDYLTSALTFELKDLHHLSKSARNDQVESAVDIARIILKNAAEHKEQLLQDKYSLQMVIECKSLVTNTADIQRASDLAKYLSDSSTNQVLFESPP